MWGYIAEYIGKSSGTEVVLLHEPVGERSERRLVKATKSEGIFMRVE